MASQKHGTTFKTSCPLPSLAHRPVRHQSSIFQVYVFPTCLLSAASLLYILVVHLGSVSLHAAAMLNRRQPGSISQWFALLAPQPHIGPSRRPNPPCNTLPLCVWLLTWVWARTRMMQQCFTMEASSDSMVFLPSVYFLAYRVKAFFLALYQFL